jgi:hypothetical protein
VNRASLGALAEGNAVASEPIGPVVPLPPVPKTGCHPANGRSELVTAMKAALHESVRSENAVGVELRGFG